MNRAAERNAALRALAEGAAPEFALLAAASGRLERTLEAQAAKEGWALRRAEAAIDERLRRLLGNLVARLETLIDRMEHDLTEAGLKAVTGEIANLLRSIEKLQAMLPGTENNNKNKDKDAMLHDAEARDRELARLHKRIDARIVELAAEAAGRMVERELERRGVS